MTVITVEDYNIRVEGHTGYAPLGEDIACAGISTLLYALGEWVERNSDKARDCAVDLSSGAGDVYFEPLEEYSDIWNALCEAFTLGCEGLCELFPDHIALLN